MSKTNYNPKECSNIHNQIPSFQPKHLDFYIQIWTSRPQEFLEEILKSVDYSIIRQGPAMVFN